MICKVPINIKLSVIVSSKVEGTILLNVSTSRNLRSVLLAWWQIWISSVITTGKNLKEQEKWKIVLDGRKKNGWLENFGHKDQSIDSIFQDKICQPFNNLPSGSKVWEKTVFDCMVCRSRVECQMIRKAFMIYIWTFGYVWFRKIRGKMGMKENRKEK